MSAAVSLPSACATLLIGVGCFAFGCLVAGACRKWSGLQCLTRSLAASPDAREAEAGGRKQNEPAFSEIESLAEIIDDFKMVLVVRNDLKMGKGKIAAQCSHATIGLYKKLLHKAPKSLSRWENCGQVKVVLKIESEEDLLVLQEVAKSLMLPTHVTVDAGRTQIAANSMTVLSILGPADLVDDVTGELKLL